MVKDTKSKFLKDVHRGREFEAEERAGWSHIERRHIKFESPTVQGTKRGRIDIKIDEDLPYIAVIETKATDWDNLKPHRIRATAPSRRVFTNCFRHPIFFSYPALDITCRWMSQKK